MGHISSDGEHMSHVPWPQRNMTFFCLSRQIVHVFTDSISFTFASRFFKDANKSSYRTESASFGAVNGCMSKTKAEHFHHFMR